MNTFLLMLLECTVTTSVIALILWAFTPALQKRYRAITLYIAWILVLFGFAIPFRPHLAPAAITVSVPAPRAIVQQGTRAARVTPSGPSAQGAQALAAPQSFAQEASADTDSVPPAIPFTINADELLLAVWALGACLALGIRLRTHRRFLRTVRRWRMPVTDPDVIRTLADAQQSLGMKRSLPMFVCPSVDSPMVTGLLRPIILLPDTRLSQEELALVLRHELIHIKRGDLWGKALMLLTSSLHWFNPLIPVICRQASFQCEASCDAEVMRDMGLASRQRYSHTILHTIRVQRGVHTALSTRYHGGKHTLKRRILQILDTRRKRIGILLVACLLSAIVGAGMAFALAGEGALTDPIARLNERLILLINRFNVEHAPLPTTYEFDDSQPEDMDFEALNALLDDYEQNIDQVPELINSLDRLRACKPSEDVETLANAVLEAAGYAVPIVGYTRQDAQPLPGQFTETWTVFADSQARASRAADVVLKLASSDHLISLNSADFAFYEYGNMETEPLTDDQRAFVRETAQTFAQQYVQHEDRLAGISLVSDVQILRNESEPFACAWAFYAGTSSPDGARIAYDSENHEANLGYTFAIGVESGRVLCAGNGYSETEFANMMQAATDFTQTTGLPYPYPDQWYMWNVVAQDLLEKIGDLRFRYHDALSQEDRVIAYHMWGGEYHYLDPNGDWDALGAALDACTSAEDFAAVLHTDFAAFNQTPQGEPDRDTVFAAIEDTLAAFGYADLPHRSFLYSGPYADIPGLQRYEVLLADDFAEDDANHPMHSFLVSINVDGLVAQVEGFYAESGSAVAITPEEAAFVRERALTLTLAYTAQTPIEDTAVVSNYVYENTLGERVARVAIHTTHTWENSEGIPEEFDAYIAYAMDVNTGLVYSLSHWDTDIDFDSVLNYPIGM